MRFADMHVHTRASDGSMVAEEVVKQAKELGLAAVGIADHDSVDGIEAALRAGEKFGVEVLPAVELSSEECGSEVHLLGYYVDWKAKPLLARLEEFQRAREDRAKLMVERLRKLGIEITHQEVLELAEGGAVGRPHIARAMVKRGHVKSLEEAFDRYLQTGGEVYVPKFRFSPAKAIELVRAVGGIPVLAHPASVSEEALLKLVERGLRGIEVYHRKHDASTTARLKKLAKKYELLITGGTDSHGFDIPVGTVRVPYELVEKLKVELKSDHPLKASSLFISR